MNLISQDAIDVERWRRIESVLDSALDLEPQEIQAYLDRACAGSPELRAEVEALLEADRHADGFLSVPAIMLANAIPGEGVAPASAAASPHEAPAPPAPPPERVGRYRVLGELGRGGMGIVYRGRDEALDREVAIKALPAPVASDPGRLARFLREARLLGALHHPNIAGIHGVEQAGGRRYLILELVRGRTLSDRLRAGPLPLRDALDWCAQVAAALATAHAHGIVHRDLKPGNVMRTPDGLVKVLDFGLAMHVSHEEPEAEPTLATSIVAGVTRTGARLGTPGYMSPEQILGLPQDARTDLFALGAVLYHCLAGARAFPGASVYGVIGATLNASVDDTRLPAETPAPVRALLDRMLEKDPSRRLADAAEAAAVLGAAEAGAGPAPARAHGRAPFRLPEVSTAIVGRRREIADALALLGRAPLVTLTGPAGCGKTRVAIEIARAAHGAVADEIWFADLASATDAGALAAAVAAGAGLRDPSEGGLEDALAARLGASAGLLVLDNCDRVMAASAALAGRLLERPLGLRILATSREWLGVSGEQTLHVGPLSVPDPDAQPTRDTCGAADSIRVFVACANASGAGFRLTDSNAALVAGICRDLDGVPLAIELTAALLRHQTLEDVARDLRRRRSPDASAADRVPRHDALLASIQLSYDRLTDDERHLLRALSVFTGGWNLESATAVCGTNADPFATLDLLTRLIDKSLVAIQRADRIEPRYRFLESIHHFAAVRCEDAREAVALRARHLEWFLAVAERAAPSLLSGSHQAHWLASLEADHPNVLAALATCESTPGGAAMALRLAGAVWMFWYVRGHFARGRDALSRALGLPGAEAPTPERAQALFAAGGLALFQGDFAAGRRLSQSALELYESLGDRLGVARSLSHLALCESGEGRPAAAREWTERAIEIFRAAGDGRRLSAALNNLGVLERQQGDYEAALVDHDEALDLLRRAGNRDAMIVTLVNLGLAAVRLGREAMAGSRVDEALALVQDLRAKRSGAAALEVAAEVLAGRGLVEDAVRLQGAAMALRSAIGLPADPWWRQTQAELATRLRAMMGADGFERLLAEGGERGFESAVHDARLLLGRGNAARERAPDEGTTRLESASARWRNE